MPSTEIHDLEVINEMWKNVQRRKFLLPILGIGIAIAVIIAAISIITLIRVNNQLNDKRPLISTKTFQQSSDSILASSIHIDEVMSYLNELQRIATIFNGTRAVDTPGFDATLDYITNYLGANTNYNITKSIFSVTPRRLPLRPTLLSSINGTVTNHTFSMNLDVADFHYVESTSSTNFTEYLNLTVIPNLGCSDEDWQKANPTPKGRIALVKRGDCTFLEKGALAAKYNVAALLIYNDGTSSDRMSPLFITLGENNTLPALFLSFRLGQMFADAAQRTPGNVRILINITRTIRLPFPSANICADTPTGDPTQTIVIGSHSDGVPEGPGINDNGSGSAANLALAVAVARLFRTSTYPKYKYRIRFCWWGAEEIGLLGSDYHVKQAKNSSIIGERLSDYLINLNYDMLGSPNYIFGIYDGRTAKNNTPSRALPGSNKITALYKQWFEQQKLPWDYTDFSGRSDYGPFLAEGIVAGGLFSGADDKKSQAERNRYDEILGQGLGGIPDIPHDPCYHKDCDSIQNINVFAFEKMIQAAAYVLEYLARQDDLKAWLYPSIDIQHFTARSQSQIKQPYNSINEYFDLPYL